MKPENANALGLLADHVDNLVGALKLPLLPGKHVEQMKGLLPALRNDLRKIYTDETGENPWEGEPE